MQIQMLYVQNIFVGFINLLTFCKIILYVFRVDEMQFELLFDLSIPNLQFRHNLPHMNDKEYIYPVFLHNSVIV